MINGLRVVRGPDWKHGNQDGGTDHVGTVIDGEGDDAVKVQWDMGSTSVCTVRNGTHELRILDSASIGITHPNSGCVSCEEVCIVGTLWKCSTCPNTNLCSICYHDDKHNASHIFLRVDYPGSEPVQLPKRLTSQKARALGIYPNAIVARGPDWKSGDQDGGPGHHGTVEDILNFGQDASDRNAVRVRWNKGYTGVYRIGYQGHVDLTCIEEAPGGSYYPGHLASLDLDTHKRVDKILADVLSVGDVVCVEVTVDQLKQLQLVRRNWSTRMEEVIGELGKVNRFTSEGDVEVDYDGDSVIFVKAAVCKVPIHEKGDKVKVIGNRDKMKRLQRKHGGWDDGMEEVMNQIATVSVVDKDGDVGVTFDDGIGFVFHPACLITVQKGDIDSESNSDEDEECKDIDQDEEQQILEPTEADESDDEEDGEVNLMQALAGLLLLEALSNQPADSSNEQRFLAAVNQGNAADVEQMLQRCPAFKDLKQNGIPVLLLASYHGYIAVINVLLEAGADVQAKDEKGNSALIIAISTGKGDAAKFLITKDADVNAANVDGRTAIHSAASGNMTSVLKLLLEHDCNPNLQDVLGDTPLHDAISERHDESATILIQHPNIDVWLQNMKKFNVMHLACLKGHACAVDKLLTKDPKLVSCAKADGFLPLHIASINNNINEASVLLIKGRADVDAKTLMKQTALHVAASEAYFDMVKLLLTYGADWKIKDAEGNTALHLCMTGRRTNELFLQLLGLRNLSEDSERIKIANFLIQHGASIDITNNLGKTPITVCQLEHMREAVSDFAAKNKPTVAQRPKARPSTAKVEQEIFTSSAQMCHKCSEASADIRFLPCKHKISCQKCCFMFKNCPICNKVITKRTDKNNRTVDSSCVIS